MLLFSKKWDIISLKGISDILPPSSENQLKIIRIAKHPTYPDSWLISESWFSEKRGPEKRKQTGQKMDCKSRDESNEPN